MNRRIFTFGSVSLGLSVTVRDHTILEMDTLRDDDGSIVAATRLYGHPAEFKRTVPVSRLQLLAFESSREAQSYFGTMHSATTQIVGVPFNGLESTPEFAALGDQRFATVLVAQNDDLLIETRGIAVRVGKLIGLWGATLFGHPGQYTWGPFFTSVIKALGTLRDTHESYSERTLSSLLPAPSEPGPGWTVRLEYPGDPASF